MYSVSLIAKYIIQYCNEHNLIISNLKLQKLLYFIQAEFLVKVNQPCFPEEIEAWDFGPVVPQIYHKYKMYGSSNIPDLSNKDKIKLKNEEEKMINNIINQSTKYSTSQLVSITHHQTPWVNAYYPYMNNVISKESIKNFFK